MTDFEKMYQEFGLSDEQRESLVRFSQSEHSNNARCVRIALETIVSDNGRAESIDKEVSDAKLV